MYLLRLSQSNDISDLLISNGIWSFSCLLNRQTKQPHRTVCRWGTAAHCARRHVAEPITRPSAQATKGGVSASELGGGRRRGAAFIGPSGLPIRTFDPDRPKNFRVGSGKFCSKSSNPPCNYVGTGGMTATIERVLVAHEGWMMKPRAGLIPPRFPDYTSAGPLGSADLPLVAMVVFRKRVLVATATAVFERGDDGVFRECRFERIRDGG